MDSPAAACGETKRQRRCLPPRPPSEDVKHHLIPGAAMNDVTPGGLDDAAPPERRDAPLWASLPPALWELRDQNQWVVWRERTIDGKKKKPPYRAKEPGQEAKIDDPSTWGTYEEVKAAALKTPGGGGIGFVLTDTDIVLLDFDECRDPITSQLTHGVDEILSRVADCYAEVSPSGTGLHIYGRVREDRKINKRLQLTGGGTLEIYCRTGRYTTITGETVGGPGKKLLYLDKIIDELLDEFDPNASKTSARPSARAQDARSTQRESGGASYAAQRLKAFCEELASMVDGEGRNTKLNKYAFQMGQMVARGWIAIEAAKEQLRRAAQNWPDYTRAEIQGLLNRVIHEGTLKPHPDVGGSRYLVIDHITKENTTPHPRYIVTVEGKKVIASARELHDFNKFCTTALEVVNHSFRFEKKDAWSDKLNEALNNRFDEVEVPVDVTELGAFQDLLNEFLNNRRRGKAREDILLGRPWEDEEAGIHYFTIKDLQKFLQREKYDDCSRSHLMDQLRQIKGKPHQLTIKTNSVRLWAVPKSSLEGPPTASDLPAAPRSTI
jgi:hypothetical protein